MYRSNCRAYLRHDSTVTIKQIRLSEDYWSLIESKQKEIAKAHNVPRVSRPLALSHILDQACKYGICHRPSDHKNKHNKGINNYEPNN